MNSNIFQGCVPALMNSNIFQGCVPALMTTNIFQGCVPTLMTNHGFIGFDYQKDGKKIDFGDAVLGGSFRSHHGRWQQDSTRGIIVEQNKDHPVLKGVKDIWGTSDVYRTYKEGGGLPEGCLPLVDGQPLMGRKHDDAVNTELIPLPVAWVKTWTGNAGQTARVFHVTMGSAQDFQSEGLRRLTVNAAYWCLQT